MTYNKLGFAFTGLRTVSYAIIEKAYKKTGETNLMTELGFGLNMDDHVVTCNTRFSFEKKKDQPFLILEVQALFEFEKDDFLNKVKQNDNTYLVARALAVHFAVLTIGSARGILHAKTEGTLYNEFLLPTMNVNNILENDLIFEF